MNILDEFRKWIPDGFQIKTIRRPVKNVPEWVNNERLLRERIFGQAMRRYLIAHLYWRCGWNAREVSEELGITPNAVKLVIHKLLVSQ